MENNNIQSKNILSVQGKLLMCATGILLALKVKRILEHLPSMQEVSPFNIRFLALALVFIVIGVGISFIFEKLTRKIIVILLGVIMVSSALLFGLFINYYIFGV